MACKFKRQIGILTGGADLEENGVAGMGDGIMLTLNGQVSADGVFSGIESDGSAWCCGRRYVVEE